MSGPYSAADFSCPFDWIVNAWYVPHNVPVGWFWFPLWIADTTSLIPTCRLANALGSSCTRTAYFCAPYTFTCATPLICEMRCAIVVSAYSSTSLNRIVDEESVR